MNQVIITIDYEIHGNGDGSPYKLMVEPTDRMLKLFDQYGAKLTILADVAEILKFKEYKETFGEDKYDYDAVLNQLKHAIKTGHDVQLHIHSGYFKSEFTDKGIKQSWDEYDLANLPYELIYKRINQCKSFLEENLKEVNPNYECIAFRAANWSMMPTKNIAKALIENGIKIDTSVFKWGYRNGRVKFDYSPAYDKLRPWFINNDNVCEKDDKGQLLEIPIYTEQKNFLSFVTPIRAFRMVRAQMHKHERFESNDEPKFSEDKAVATTTPTVKAKKKSMVQKLVKPFFKKHAWKLDINQASGSQLINATKRIKNEYKTNETLPIVLIGHSKSFIPYNSKTLKPYLEYIAKNANHYSFATFNDVDAEKFR